MVAVVQPADVRHRDELARFSKLDGPAHGHIVAQCETGAPVMVVVNVRSQHPLP